ncbi:hypothetical protein IH799_04315 [candidate division KSB1 bacterium]|nr:hypothetical protein [candidate division KSB1 bacterium]
MKGQTQQPHFAGGGNLVLDIQEGICLCDLRRIFENFDKAVLLNNKDSVAAVIAMRQKKRLVEAEIRKGFYEYHIIIFS